MVLRDNRDKMTSKRVYQRSLTRTIAKWRKRSKKKNTRTSRTKIKKNTNKIITILTKNQKKYEIKKENIIKNNVCSICCESKKEVKYINCKRGGLQTVNFGKYSECCKDKTICSECITKCSDCPFCKQHKLVSLKNKYNKKKVPFKIRIEKINNKKKDKLKKQIRKNYINQINLRLTMRLSNMYAPTVYIMNRNPWSRESSLARHPSLARNNILPM